MRMRILLVCCAALALTAGAASDASAGPGISVSGTYSVTDFGATTCAPVGSSSFKFRCDTTGLVSQYSGDLVGDAVADFTSLINCKTGRTWGRGVETFTGSLNGSATGTLMWKISFRSDFDCATSLPSGFKGRSHIKASSGALAGIRGRLHFGDVTYDGVLR